MTYSACQIRRGTWDMEDEDVLIWGDVDEILPGTLAPRINGALYTEG